MLLELVPVSMLMWACFPKYVPWGLTCLTSKSPAWPEAPVQEGHSLVPLWPQACLLLSRARPGPDHPIQKGAQGQAEALPDPPPKPLAEHLELNLKCSSKVP